MSCCQKSTLKTKHFRHCLDDFTYSPDYLSKYVVDLAPEILSRKYWSWQNRKTLHQTIFISILGQCSKPEFRWVEVSAGGAGLEQHGFAHLDCPLDKWGTFKLFFTLSEKALISILYIHTIYTSRYFAYNFSKNAPLKIVTQDRRIWLLCPSQV